MRIMGLDLGDKTIGVAISDAMKWTAQGLETIQRKQEKQDVQRLREIVSEHEVESIVLGLPVNMNGTMGPRSELVKNFAAVLEKQLKLPVYFWDERLSTVAAERTLLEADVSRKKRKHVIDKLAAVIILQGYLDARQGK